MSTSARNQPRQPRCVPTGGQWRATNRPEGNVSLVDAQSDGGPSPAHKVALGVAIGAAAVVSLAPSAAATTNTTTPVAHQHEIGIVPPANPPANCTPLIAISPASGVPTKDSVLRAIDLCRRDEGVGPMVLPSNWAQLTPAEQMFVAVDLERVNRGEQPITGLNGHLDALARAGARAGADPVGPVGMAWGGVWDGWHNALAGVEAMMYDDGPGSYNLRCTARNTSGCWGHRDDLLAHTGAYGGELVAGASCAQRGCTMLIVWDNAPVWFRWANEVHYFARLPAEEPVSPLSTRER